MMRNRFHGIDPRTVNRMNGPSFIFPTPAPNDTSDRTTGTIRPKNAARLPHLAKNPSVLSRSSSVNRSHLPHRMSTGRPPQ